MTNEFDKEFLDDLLEQACQNPLKRQVYLMKAPDEGTMQRRLTALQMETMIPIHQHPHSAENVLCLRGRLDEVIYSITPDPSEETAGGTFEMREIERHHLCPAEGRFGCQIPAGAWHTIEVLEPSVVYETNGGRYKEDGTTYFNDYETREVSHTLVPPKVEPPKQTLAGLWLKVLPMHLFTMEKLPCWCMLGLDCLTLLTAGFLSLMLFVEPVVEMSMVRDYLFFWLSALPLFIIPMLTFRICSMPFCDPWQVKSLAIACALTMGGLLVIGYCWLNPFMPVPLTPLICSTAVTVVCATLLLILYRWGAAKMLRL